MNGATMHGPMAARCDLQDLARHHSQPAPDESKTRCARRKSATGTWLESPVRTWHDRQGNVLAEGRLTNIKRGRALILDGNNQIVRIPFNDL